MNAKLRDRNMFNIDFTRTALAAVGALLLSATAVSAAVGPAWMVETARVGYAGDVNSAEGAAHA
jgi:hypothetical protein